jgi:hypothetical protein
MKIEISNPRSDGKYPVTLIFEGAPNMFGGCYPAKIYRKLYSLEKARETVTKHGTDEQKARLAVAIQSCPEATKGCLPADYTK